MGPGGMAEERQEGVIYAFGMVKRHRCKSEMRLDEGTARGPSKTQFSLFFPFEMRTWGHELIWRCRWSVSIGHNNGEPLPRRESSGAQHETSPVTKGLVFFALFCQERKHSRGWSGSSDQNVRDGKRPQRRIVFETPPRCVALCSFFSFFSFWHPEAQMRSSLAICVLGDVLYSK